MAYCAGARSAAKLIIGQEERSGEDHNSLEIAGSNPAPGTPAILIISHRLSGASLHIPLLSVSDYYNFLSTTMIVLFIVGLVIVFVYEYEALRRSRV